MIVPPDVRAMFEDAHRAAVGLALTAEPVITDPHGVDVAELRAELGRAIDEFIGEDGDRAAALVSATLQLAIDAITAGRLATGPAGWLSARDISLS